MINASSHVWLGLGGLLKGSDRCFSFIVEQNFDEVNLSDYLENL